MPKVLKIILIIFASVVVLGGGCYYVCGTLFENMTTGLKESGEKVQAEAKIWSKGKTQTQALEESIRRAKECSSELDIACVIHRRLFLRFTLEQTKPVKELCKGVPETTEIMKTVAWRNDRCQILAPAQLQICTNVIAAVQDYCESQAEKKGK